MLGARAQRESMQKYHHSDLVAVAALSFAWLVPVLLIGTHGDFSLNDDWAYARAAQRVTEIGLIERVAWTWVPAISHAWFGAFFATILDGPFLESVRFTGIVFGWLGMIGTYALARTVGAQPLGSGFAAATLGLNPLYLSLSFTYMTDVPFAACVIWSLAAYCRAFRRQSWTWLLVASGLALLAVLTRQTGVALPMMVAIALIVAAPRDPRSWAAAIGTNLLVFGGYSVITRFAYGPLDAQMFFSAESVEIAVRGSHAPYHLVKNSLAQLAYLGCFAAPVLLLGALAPRSLRLGVWVGGLVFAALGVAAVASLDIPLPPGINIIYNLGLGRRGLTSPELLPSITDGPWWLLVALGFALSGAGLLASLVGALPRYREIRARPDLLLCMGLPIVFLAPHLIRAPCFDRYILPVLAPILVVLLTLPMSRESPTRTRLLAASVSLALLASFAIVGTRDYMQHHRTRAALLDGLLADGVAPERIDGGFEFNGLHSLQRQDGPDGPTWVYVHDSEYVVTERASIPGYELVASGSFARLMPPGPEVIRVQRRTDPDARSEHLRVDR